VATVDTLSLPFATWQEGLLALADALQDPNREKIIAARLEATAAQNGIGPTEICALALLVRSHARFEPAEKHEPHPDAVRLAAKIGDTLGRIFEANSQWDRIREARIFSAFSESDPRRILNDTILGSAAAELSDVSQRLGESDPFSRLAGRLSFWFKQSHDYSRHGLALAWDGWATVNVVRRAAEKLDPDATSKIGRLIRIWAGDVEVERSEEGINEIASLLSPFQASNTGRLDAVLTTEILGALVDGIDELDTGSLETFSEVLGWLSKGLDDGRPITSDLRTWLRAGSHHGNHFRLVYDPSEAFSSAMYVENADVLEPLLATTLKQMEKGGHACFSTGPLPLRGNVFKRKSKMIESLSEHAPEAADLIRLLGVDGDYNDIDGPYPRQCYWVGDFNPDTITFLEAIKNADERGDHALGDMLIGCWILFCALYQRAPLPDIVGLAGRITALPADHRSSTYAVLGMLKREAVENPRLRRDVDAILSRLPLVDTAPPDDFEANMRDEFTPKLWDTIHKDERESLIRAEEFFVRIRRLGQLEREKEPLDMMILNWSKVAERFMRRLLSGMGGSGGRGKPLGLLIGTAKKVLEQGNDSWSFQEKDRLRFVPAALNELDQLDFINKKGVKHLDGVNLTWEHVVNVHVGIGWALKTLLEVASGPAATAKSD
jgi:hypothetical protein